VLPYLRASRGRLITTTSLNGVIAAPYNDAYAASRFALEGVIANTGAVQPCEEVARVVVDLLSADEPPLRVQSSPPSRLAAGPRVHHASHSAVISGP
jgi:hypothetical protein